MDAIKYFIITAILALTYVALIYYNYIEDNKQTILATTYSEEAEISTGGGGVEIITSDTGMAECPVLGE